MANKVWKLEIMEGQKKGGREGGREGGMKGRHEGRKDGRTEEIEWKNKGRNNRGWKKESRRTRKKIEKMETRKKE